MQAPGISLPKGGGAIRGIGEKFAANPITGTGSMTVTIATSPGRSGFGPQLALSYDSGGGNGPFGLGWLLGTPQITRKTDKGLPKYNDAEESDVFILSGAEDLVPVYRQDIDGTWTATHPGYQRDPGKFWVRDGKGKLVIHEDDRTIDSKTYHVRRYRPRIEGLFARIERWTNATDALDIFWRSISKDNITTWYGRPRKNPDGSTDVSHSRIADPTDPTRIFTWLICQSYDDKGNVLVYHYKPEDSARIFEDARGKPLAKAHERNRTAPSHSPDLRSAQRYLKRIRYGNHTPYFPELKAGAPWPEPPGDSDPDASTHWLFEIVLDYGEHNADAPTPNDSDIWPVRNDPFSTYRAGFEVRTYRLCQRVLMFHHFPGELGVGADCLVRATDFDYSYEANPTNARNPIYSFVLSVNQSGYKRKSSPETGYLKKSMPPVEFTYSEAIIQAEIREVDAASLENLPAGLDGSTYQWVDLDGEGLSGILTEQAGGWFYKRNLSPINTVGTNGSAHIEARFAPVELVASKPALSLASNAQFMDLAGDGQLDVVVLEGSVRGFYERTYDADWEPFRTFHSFPNLDTRDPNLKFIDLDGDGLADILISEDEIFRWHPSLAEDGFGPSEYVRQSRDEETGPRLVFANAEQSIYLADLSGDGLTDLVRIRNGEVCYWPNLGYGRFGAKVTMDNSPLFDRPDQFDQKRIRLADIDGSGSTDIIYLHSDGPHLYFNQCGNGWSQPRALVAFPSVDNLATIHVVDLLGNGTACLVWSSPLLGDTFRPMRYIDLMGGQKPHLLVKTVNNLGAETVVSYAPSTQFYLQDKQEGKPWITKLPFPVHVVARVETYDYISRNRFVTRNTYHHGYFDGAEREFRGFGMVEQWDSEAFEDYVVGVKRVEGNQELAPELNQPSVTTRTWYHTGAFLDLERIVHQFRHEYYRQEQHIPEPVLPAELDADELRECLRALKGLPLRQEIYSFDGSPEEKHPYTVVENNFEIRCLQPRENQRHAVFFPVGRESVSLNYERNPIDPRVSHSLGLDLDEYGYARKSCSVVYGRKVADASLPAEVTRDQQKLHVTYSETDYTPDIDQGNPTEAYRLRVPHESRAYEITGIAPTSSLFQFDEIKAKIAGTAEISYEVLADGVTPQKRLLSHGQTLFLDNALNPLPPGQWDSLALGYQSYQLAFTPGVTGTHYAGKVTDAEFAAAGYLHFNGDANWWIPSGTAIYHANPQDHFYLPIGAKDPLGAETIATRDKYDLLGEKVEVKQATWNVTTAVNDYRILGPILTTDPNKNRSTVEIDELGMVVRSAIMGKAGSTDGDTLADPTTRMEYELFNWMNNRQPNYVHTFAREKHGAANPRWQESYVYSNGSGGVAMAKAQAHPGKAFKVNPDGTKAEVDADPRWVGNGRTILNNKGKPVKQYEPFFSTTHEYENEKVLREIGVTPVLYYDSVGRTIRTLFPNGTFARVEFNPWLQKVFDANDTVRESQWYIARGSPDPATDSEPLNDSERRSAWLAAKHADTPGVIHFDSLGRPVYAISDYGGGKTAAVRSESDLTGRFSKLFDQEQREVATGFVGMAGTPVVGESAEKGRRWTFQNVLGALVKTWDEHGRQFRAEYDNLHRPVSTFVQESGQHEILFNYVVFGDRLANAEQLNLLGTAHQIFDQAGMVRVPELDFKGNPKLVERVMAKDYTNNLDWSALAVQPSIAAIQATANSALEIGEVFTAASQHDALNRPTQVTLPDGTVILPTYNEANFLASLKAQIRGQGNFIEFLKSQDYDAKGQRQFAHYGNEVFTRYFYDPKTFRLTNLVTYKSGDSPQGQGMQNLNYTYDPIGNITKISDDAQQKHYFANAVVKPESLYEYDAIYQLVRATGREHAGLGNDAIRTDRDLDFVPQLPHANDTDAVRTYTEEYEYDLLGNIKLLKHRFQPQHGIGSGWTRHYRYAFEDDPANRTNRLTSTSSPGDPNGGPYSETYDYDAYGNMTHMPHLATMDWNFMDQLRQVDLGGGCKAHYIYGLGGQRLRKVIERNGNLKLEWIFLGAVMIFRRRRRDTNELRLERWTVHISDSTGHVAQVDTKTRDDDGNDPANPLNLTLIRYQYTNHLGSAVLETDENGNPISYEEYHPYGTTAYRSSKPGFDQSLKRYRFSGKENDDETGLYYFGARYYAPWLARWTSSDPAGFSDGPQLYRYCRNNPINVFDPLGLQGVTLGKRPDDIREAQTTHTEESGRKYEAWARAQTVIKDGQEYAVSGGTRVWNESKGNWWLPDASLVPIGSKDEPVDEVTVTASRGATGGTPPARPLMQPGPAPGAPPGTASPSHAQGAIPSAPPGTNFSREAAAGRQNYRANNNMPAGTQVQHWTKELSAKGSNMAPGVMNQNLSPLQSRNRLPATTLLTDPAGRGTTYNVSGGSTYGNEHKFADRALIPQIEDQIRKANPNADPKDVAVQAGRQARWIMTGDPGPDPSPRSAAPSFGRNFGNVAGGFARTFIPFFAEAEIAAMSAPYVVASLGITNATVVTTAAAAAAAPTAAASVVVASAVGGYVVGDFVEEAVTGATGSRAAGVGAGTLAGAATGAAIGAAIGSIVPVLGTAAGAIIGGAVGAIAGFIGAYW